MIHASTGKQIGYPCHEPCIKGSTSCRIIPSGQAVPLILSSHGTITLDKHPPELGCLSGLGGDDFGRHFGKKVQHIFDLLVRQGFKELSPAGRHQEEYAPQPCTKRANQLHDTGQLFYCLSTYRSIDLEMQAYRNSSLAGVHGQIE
jgi:hypothetical protein